MPTIAIVGAGPGLGLSIAHEFGQRGYNVALVSRNESKLAALVAELAERKIDARAFPADVMDRPGLVRALDEAQRQFGTIDVLEYSPADVAAGVLTPAHVRDTTPENTQAQIEYYLYGAQAAVSAVLPGMLERRNGTLLFTTGAGSINPVVHFGNVNAGSAALRNWALNLGNALEGDGIKTSHVAIAAWIGNQAPDGYPSMLASEISPRYWRFHQDGGEREIVVVPE